MSRPGELYVRPLSAEEQEWVRRLYDHTGHVGLKSRCLLAQAQSGGAFLEALAPQGHS